VQTTDAPRNERQVTVALMPNTAPAACISPGGSGGPCSPLVLRETKIIDPLVTQSSTYEPLDASYRPLATFEARLAVDADAPGYSGDFWNGRSCSATNNEYQPWWQEDLGSVRQINSIAIYGRTDCCPDMSTYLYVLVSTTPITATSLANAFSQSSWNSGYVTTTQFPITLTVNASGRYVRIWKSDTNWLVLAEVLVQ
jgi:hypothetical protein